MSFLKRIPEQCTGCLACELSCSLHHFGYFDHGKSRVRIIQDEELSEIEIHQCIQCEERSCVYACPKGALTIDARYGYVSWNKELCIQCKKCFTACNYNGVMWDEERNVPLICDLCGGDPECIKPCELHKALILETEEVHHEKLV